MSCKGVVLWLCVLVCVREVECADAVLYRGSKTAWGRERGEAGRSNRRYNGTRSQARN